MEGFQMHGCPSSQGQWTEVSSVDREKKTVWPAVAVHLLLRTLFLEHPYKHIYVSIRMVYLPT